MTKPAPIRVDSRLPRRSHAEAGAFAVKESRHFAWRVTLYVSEVADALRVTEQHVRDLIDQGRLRAINVGTGERKFWRIPVVHYEAFVAERDSGQA